MGLVDWGCVSNQEDTTRGGKGDTQHEKQHGLSDSYGVLGLVLEATLPGLASWLPGSASVSLSVREDNSSTYLEGFHVIYQWIDR